MKSLFDKFKEKFGGNVATITINGVSIIGNSINIRNNKVIIDGVDQTPDAKIVNITVHGNIETLSVDAAQKVMVNGEVGSISTMSGDVDASGDVRGDISTQSGDVECGNVAGNVSTMSGDVDAEAIHGSVKTLSGDISV